MKQDLINLVYMFGDCNDRWLKGELGKLLVKAVDVWVNGPSWDLTIDEARLVFEGKKIPAVKAFKDRVGCTLLEAKNAIEGSADYKEYLERRDSQNQPF